MFDVKSGFTPRLSSSVRTPAHSGSARMSWSIRVFLEEV
jgi:hypothetical protein